MRNTAAAFAIAGLIAMAGCARASDAGADASAGIPAASVPGESPEVRIIVGTGDNHVVITRPLQEIVPPANEHNAHLTIGYVNTDVQLGIEGSVPFVKATDPTNAVVLDVIVNPGGDVVDVPPGQYLLKAYYRTCDGNCALLDPPHAFCSTDAFLAMHTRYELIVDIKGNTCTFQ